MGRRHAHEFIAAYDAHHGQAESIAQTTFNQIVTCKHRPLGHAHRQQVGMTTGCAVQPICFQETQVRDKPEASNFLQGPPFSLQQQSVPFRDPALSQVLNFSFGQTVKSQHMDPMLTSQAALPERGARKR